MPAAHDLDESEDVVLSGVVRGVELERRATYSDVRRSSTRSYRCKLALGSAVLGILLCGVFVLMAVWPGRSHVTNGLGWDYTSGDPLIDCALSCRSAPYRDIDPDADVLIVGAGLSGAILAHLHALVRGERVLVLDRRNHIAGNMYDYVDSNGMRSSMYGPHYFHTVDERVWQFLNRFSDWQYYEYRVKANVTDKDGNTIFPTIPININTVNEVFGMNMQTQEEMAKWLNMTQDRYPGGPKNAEEAARERVGKTLYEKFFEGYTTKQWDRPPKDLYPSVTQRIPVWSTHDDRYFNDAHQAMPVKGFTELIRPMLTHRNIRYVLNADFFEFRKFHDVTKFKRIYYTGPVDQYFADQGMEKLEYRSLSFNIVTEQDVDLPDGTHMGHPWARCIIEKERAYFGRMIRLAPDVKTHQQCCALCSNTQGCRWWTWEGPMHERCRLLASRGSELSVMPGGVSGQRLGKTFQAATTVNQPSVTVQHTRCVEYKWLPWDHLYEDARGLPHTSLFYEYPSGTGEPYYPIPNDRNMNLFHKYQELSDVEEKNNNVVFVGRLANYKYFNMDQTASNALKIFDRLYPELAPVVPVNSQDLIVVTVLHPSPARYDATARPTAGHWQGICRLAHQIARDDGIMWLVVDQGNEAGDDNVKELIKGLKLPARSAYIYGNGAEKGLDIAFEHIRRNKIMGTVYLANSDDSHNPQLWEVLRKRSPKAIGILTTSVGDAIENDIAFDASKLHSPEPRSWGIEWVRGLVPGRVRGTMQQTGKWQSLCLGDAPCHSSSIGRQPLVVRAMNRKLAKQEERVPEMCVNTPGERAVSVVQL